jgi:allophanate hydrolase
MPAKTAPAVAQALDAGALLIGKNSLDQFATGLVGIRSPGGYCRNTFDERYIPGGSSSGSGVAVAAGLVSFALGSDTGGSGRVPAALNNIVGLKPSVDLVSNEGMVYCNRSFDCMPVFALTCNDAWQVLRCIQDPKHPVSDASPRGAGFIFAIPRADQLNFFGDTLAEQAFARAVDLLRGLGGQAREIDFAPFLQAGRMVFDDALIAERYAEYGDFVEHHPDDVLPVTKAIITKARGYSAVDAYRALYRLDELRRITSIALRDVHCLVVPTTGTIYRCDEVEADPVALNTNMGYYTYFVNPLDLCAIAVPAGLRDDGLPHGVSLIARSGKDATLVDLALSLEAITSTGLGATPFALPPMLKPSPVRA